MVLVLAAVEAVAAIGAVKPHFELVFAVLCGFETLAQEHLFYIAVGAVESRVAIPRRDVEAIFHVELARGIGEVAGNVGLLGVDVGRGRSVVVGGGSGPEAETVVVLDHRDTTAHAGVFGGLKPLLGVGHLGGGETIYVFITFTPFQTGVGVHAVVEEGIELCLLPFPLTVSGNREHWTWFVLRIGSDLRLKGHNGIGLSKARSRCR